ncbi:MAG TPA: HD domain-containing phosphohydrolase [Candidatus Limnocylindria bacterium]|nr:HD domain-containing phosphohydrolase [Candidatus Limnocylindria bacterium]
MSAIRNEPSIVVVEDDAASADVLQRRLQANGMTVAVGRTGADGLALIRDLHPDLVLLDVGLPDTDGYDVCLQVKSDGATSDIPVIFLSARGDVFDKVRGLSCGASDYLTKPFHPAELLARVDAVLSQSRRVRRPRLTKPADTARTGRPTAIVALADQARRERAELILGAMFEIIQVGSEGRVVDLLVVDADASITAQTGTEGPTVLRVAPPGAPANPSTVALSDELVRIANLEVRERELARDVDAAAEALVALAMAFESHDRATAGHSERVADRAVVIATAIGLDAASCQTIRVGALLRDIGNTKLPLGLVRSASELTPGERKQIERHPALGEELLAPFRPLSRLLPIVRSHHEHLDGSGYPDGLKAPQIPLEVRIVAAADRYEALRIDRPDRPAMSADAAVSILQQSVQRGELDAAVVAALATSIRSDRGEATGT